MNKETFLKELDIELKRRGVIDSVDIINDFDHHFRIGIENGKSEEEVCLSLGDISEIVSQYEPGCPVPVYPVNDKPKNNTVSNSGEITAGADSHSINNSAVPCYEDSGIKIDLLSAQNKNEQSKRYEDSGIKVNIAGIIGCILVDIFILSWALGVALSLLGAILAAALSLFGSALAMFFGSIITVAVPFTYTVLPFTGIASIFGGIALLALSGLFVILFILAVKLFIKAIKVLVNWHSKSFAGKVVFKDKSAGVKA